MSVERRDNDKQVEETKKQIEDVEKKVNGCGGFIDRSPDRCADGRAYLEE
jgi:hypothetical protein